MRSEHRDLIVSMLARHDAQLEAATRVDENREQTIRDLVAKRDELVKAIATGLADTLTPQLESLIESATYRELQERADSAYFVRDRAMAAVWRVSMIHHLALDGTCSCKKPLTACTEYTALEFFWDSFDRWQGRQVERLREGKPHGLPLDHPESQKRFTTWYDWKGRESTDPRHRRRQVA
jgi:hypothetical protein